jgi:prevent-host-death family protein
MYIMYKLPSIRASLIRERLAEVINKVSVRGDRVLIERHGKPVAALIPVEDLALLEELEDRYDIIQAQRILAKTKAEDWMSWEEVKRELKL